MALATPCQTPGTQFDTRISANQVCIDVRLPKGAMTTLSTSEAETLERNIHNALELVFAPFFVERS